MKIKNIYFWGAHFIVVYGLHFGNAGLEVFTCSGSADFCFVGLFNNAL